MPVALLLCEGKDDRVDQRLIHHILLGTTKVEPVGGKPNIPSLVHSLRRQIRREICGICDGDFPREPAVWTHSVQAQAWDVKYDDKWVMIGWRWRRKEIENYLLDPSVLIRAFRWSAEDVSQYEDCLEGIFDALGPATAARMALTACAPRKLRVQTEMHQLDKDEVRREMLSRAQEHARGACIDERRLDEVFAACLPMCQPGGLFRAQALDVFAGKDVKRLLFQRARPKALKSWDALVEGVLKAMSGAEQPHGWLPEWESLRVAVESWTPGP